MKGMVPPDPVTDVSRERFAVVYVPRRSRKRFPAGCVTLFESREQALEAAQPAEHRYAARVLGPSKSSEGQILFYLLDWLQEPAAST